MDREDAVSLIVSEVYDALIEAGTSEEKAKAAAGAIPVAKELATKEYLTEMAGGLETKIVDLKREMAVLKLGIFSFGPAILALPVKLVFFP